MVAKNRHEERRLQTREKLIEAAKTVFSEKGFHNTSVLDITETADVGKRTFYLHFTDKEAILDELVLSSILLIRQNINEDEERLDFEDKKAKLTNAFFHVFSWIHDHPLIGRIAFGEEGTPEMNGRMREVVAAAFLEEMSAHGAFVEESPLPESILAMAIAGMTIQVGGWYCTNRDVYTPQQMAEMMSSILFENMDDFYTEHC